MKASTLILMNLFPLCCLALTTYMLYIKHDGWGWPLLIAVCTVVYVKKVEEN
jgi:hypothetical protein